MAAKRKQGQKGRRPKRNLRQVIDPVLAKALAHPLRGHILMTLGDRVTSPSEIAKELGLAARDLSYHFKVLTEIGMIKLVRTEKRRGSYEHFYELDSRIVYLDDREWQRIPDQVRAGFGVGFLRIVVEDAVDALRAGTFGARYNHHSRIPMILDERGRGELMELMEETLEGMLRIKTACSQRRAEQAGEGIPMEVFMLGFETAAGAARSGERDTVPG